MDKITTWRERPWDSPWANDARVVAMADAVKIIGLNRSMCYGPCPTYRLVLRRIGKARFRGEHFVDLMGAHFAEIAPSDFGILALAVVYLGFDAMAGHYAVDWTDAQTTTTWLWRGNERIEIEDYGGAGPAALHLIEQLVDATASELEWRPDHPYEAPDRGGRPLFAGLDVDETWRSPSEPGRDPHWTQTGRKAH